MIMFKFILFTFLISMYHCRTPDKVYCVNQQCSEPISKAKTLLPYTSADPDFISFSGNADAFVFMKSAGSNPDVWYASINGKLGFVNSKFLREYKIIRKSAELGVYPVLPKNPQPYVQPDKVLQAHEVIDGTTILTTESSANTPAESQTEPHTPDNENVTPPLSEDSKEPQVSEPVGNGVDKESNPNDEQKEDVPTSNPEEVYIVEQATDASTESSSENQVPIESNTEADSPSQVPDEVPAIPVPQHLAVVNPGSSDSATLEVLDKVNNLQEDLLTSENENNIEQNSSNPTESSSETTQVTPETLTEKNSVPDVSNDVNVNSDIPIVKDVEKDSSLFGSFFSQESTENVNGVSSTPSPEPETTSTELSVGSTETAPVSQQDTVIESIPPPLQQQPPAHLGVIPPSFPDSNNIYGYPPIQPPPEVKEPTYDINSNEGPQTTQNPSEVNKSLFNIDSGSPAFMQAPSSEVKEPSNFASDKGSSPAYPEYDRYPYTTQSPHYAPPSRNINSHTTSQPDSSAESHYPEQVNIDNKVVSESSTEQVNIANNVPSQSQSEEATESPPDYSTTENLIDEIFTAATESPAPVNTNEEGILSNIYSTIADFWPSSTEAPLTENIYNHEHVAVSENSNIDEGFSFVNFLLGGFMTSKLESHAIFASGGESCFTEDYCDGNSNSHGNRLLTFLLTTATSVLLFTLGYYYIDNKRQDAKLIGTINSLQRDLLFTNKECEILKEELDSTKSKLAGIEDSSFGMDDMVQSLKEEIDELKAQNERLRRSLDDNEKLLRVSENTAGELQNTLGEVENTLSELLGERANLDEQIAELNGKIQAFEEELISVSRDRDSYQLKFVSAETALEEAKKHNHKLEDLAQKLVEANNTIELQKHEITALKEALKDLKNGLSLNVDVTSLIDHTEIKAKLAKATEERQSFEKKFEVEHKERKRLSEELQVTQESLVTTSQQATEALTRLEVLGKYFQERETELMKELNTKESLWLSKQGESASTVEKIELLQQEIQRHKEKCDALALELAEQESMRRTAVGEVEARAHSAWLEARAARREADAARDEAATLRRKLASVAAPGAASPHHKVASPLDASDKSVPPPLPGMGFLPPPLLPPLPPLPRPPPLGRLPSPHPPRYGDRRYSPGSRYSPESRYSPGSRYSPETVRYSPDSRYSPRVRRSPYSPRSRRRSRERYDDGRGSRSRNGPADTETEYNSDSPSREPRRRRRYSRQSGPSSGSGCSSESDK